MQMLAQANQQEPHQQSLTPDKGQNVPDRQTRSPWDLRMEHQFPRPPSFFEADELNLKRKNESTDAESKVSYCIQLVVLYLC
jgi:hypothetical protein